ncbi:MAG: VWA domain-containing protein [Sulfuritalea sp.]|nr:VWA domain-containing protein [Sulfuritalea sp.]MDP1985147.1 VWA domain-containing protein [Sulfuritalea sp.]
MKLQDMQNGKAAGFAFSAVRPEKLGATEYTLVTVVTDKTGSVSAFAGQLLEMKRAVVEACRKSPRAAYLLLRQLEFNNSVDEVHGFLELKDIDAASYVEPATGGTTALFDATMAAVAAVAAYGKTLTDADFGVNAIVFVITDGDDNASKAYGPREIAREIAEAVRGEAVESIRIVLIGVNAAQYRKELESFAAQAGIDQFVEVADATPGKLAKLAQFVSRSISSQSQSLGTGGPSVALTF